MFEVGTMVESLAGHDRGDILCIAGLDGEYVLLADGKRRKQARPKRKKLGHVRTLGTSEHPAFLDIQRGIPVSDRELRRALAAFRETVHIDQGGN